MQNIWIHLYMCINCWDDIVTLLKSSNFASLLNNLLFTWAAYSYSTYDKLSYFYSADLSVLPPPEEERTPASPPPILPPPPALFDDGGAPAESSQERADSTLTRQIEVEQALNAPGNLMSYLYSENTCLVVNIVLGRAEKWCYYVKIKVFISQSKENHMK